MNQDRHTPVRIPAETPAVQTTAPVLFWATTADCDEWLPRLRAQKAPIYTPSHEPRRGEGAAAFLKTLARLATDPEDADDVAAFCRHVDGQRRRHPDAGHLHSLIAQIGNHYDEQDEAPGVFDDWVQYTIGIYPEQVLAWFMERVHARHGLKLLTFGHIPAMKSAPFTALTLLADPSTVDGARATESEAQKEMHARTGLWDVLEHHDSPDAKTFVAARGYGRSPEELRLRLMRNHHLNIGLLKPETAEDHAELLKARYAHGQPDLNSVTAPMAAFLRFLLKEDGVYTCDLPDMPGSSVAFLFHGTNGSTAVVDLRPTGNRFSEHGDTLDPVTLGKYEHAKHRVKELLAGRSDPQPLSRPPLGA